MAEGTREDWAAATHLPQGLIYPELVHAGMVETLQQNTDAFNGAVNNVIRQVTRSRLGDYNQESFFGIVNNLISRRQVDASPANPAVTPSEMPKGEFIGIKLNRRIGPVDQTLDSFRKIGQSPDFEVISFTLGEQVAKAMQVDWLDTALNAQVAALLAQTALHEDQVQATMTTSDLVDGLARFGDAASRIKMWVMHSKVYYELVKEQIASNITNISDFNIASATPVTLNRPVLVTDSASLVGAGSPFQYRTLGLVENACVLEESEDTLLHADVITGKENIVTRMQGEYAFNVNLKGFKWDVTNGGVNPDATAVGTGTNWDKAATADKDLGGIVISTGS
jgi:hypothetical protein